MSVKAFELVPAIEREQLIGDKSSNTSIECIECCGADFFIGTSDGSIIKYAIREETKSSGKTGVKATMLALKYLPQKKSIADLRCASAIERILVLSDYSLCVLDSSTLETPITPASGSSGGFRPVKNVASFCLNENPVGDDPFTIFVCVAAYRKKAIQLFSVTGEKITSLFEKSLPDFPLKLAWDGKFVCAALASQYVMISIDKNNAGGVQIQELFPREGRSPIVKRVAKEEFLLGGPSALGMFVTSKGISERPPLQWSRQLKAVAFSHPYVLALSDELVTIHSILDFTQKQAISFIGGVVLGDFDGKLFIASPREIYALIPVSWEKQVQGLLEDGRVDEALDLAQNSRAPSSASTSGLNVLQRVSLKAGFIRFRDGNFQEAKDLFREGELDVRELISLFPLLLPADADFTRSNPPLHEMADVTQITRNDPEKMTAVTNFLVEYLESFRPVSHLRHPHARDINTALVKLYTEATSVERMDKISQLLAEVTIDQMTESDANLDYIGCEHWLKTRDFHHVAALLAQNRGNHESAIDAWVQLVDGELPDDSFPGLEFVINQIVSIPNSALMMRYSEWALSKDQTLGVKIFTSSSAAKTAVDSGFGVKEDDTFKPSVIVKRLHNRFPKALILYLEHIIFVREIESEEYHTHLALLYYERLLEMTNSQEKENKDGAVEETQLRNQFRHLLKSSRMLRLQLLLGKLKIHPRGFEYEEALLHAKLGDYASALKVFVHRLKDVEGAERFCGDFADGSSEPEKIREKLVAQLLHVYLDPALSVADRDHLAGPAVRLLNQNDDLLSSPESTIKILHSIPDHWSVTLIAPFLARTMRSSLHAKRTAQIGKNLALTRRDDAQMELLRLKRESRVRLTIDNVGCPVCGEYLIPVAEFDGNGGGRSSANKVELHRYPNGVVTHAGCGSRNRKTCPVTGQVFST